MIFKIKKFFWFFLIFGFLIALTCEAGISLKSFKPGTTYKYTGMMEAYAASGNKKTPFEYEQTICPWRKIGDQKVLPIKYVYPNRESFFNYLAEDENGIYVYARQGSMDLEPKIVQGKQYILKYPLKLWTLWEYSGTEGEFYQAWVTREEEVIVDAGSFNCIKIEIEGKQGLNGYLEKYKGYAWYDSSSGLLIQCYEEFESLIRDPKDPLWSPPIHKFLYRLSSITSGK